MISCHFVYVCHTNVKHKTVKPHVLHTQHILMSLHACSVPSSLVKMKDCVNKLVSWRKMYTYHPRYMNANGRKIAWYPIMAFKL
jgi:hypothetical protein